VPGKQGIRRSSAAAVGTGGGRRRIATARFGDLRLWLGIAIVVASVAIGVVVMTADRDTVTVLRATRDLSVGAVPSGLDRVVISRAAAGDAYLTDEPVGDAVLQWPVRAGELVPRGALAAAKSADVRQVTVAVDPLHSPVDLQTGDHVDVWASPSNSSREAAAPSKVVTDARVASVASDAVGIGGQIAVVLDLHETDVLPVVEAVRTGVVDLVAVPVDSQTIEGIAS
jgi:hypothetical protein